MSRKLDFISSDGKYNIDKENLKPLTMLPDGKPNIPFYIGSQTAEREWEAEDKELVKKMFLHTNAYREFLRDSSLILLGRTGTGKTSILRFVEAQITSGKLTSLGFSTAYRIDIYGLVSRLVSCADIFTSKSYLIANNVKESITAIINTFVMRNICIDQTNNKDDLNIVVDYLNKNGLFELKGFSGIVNKCFEITKYIKTGNDIVNGAVDTISALSAIFRTADYSKALDQFRSFLKKSEYKILVLIDSLNEYDINNPELMLIIKGIIESCFNFYNHPTNNICVKLALPAEIYNRVLQRLPGKEQLNTVVIRWKYKELVEMLALRFYISCSRGILKNELEGRKLLYDFLHFIANYRLDDFYTDEKEGSRIKTAYSNARDLLDNIFPRSCETSLSYWFDTIPYCLRHSLKKPREAMHLFNALIYEIIRNNDVNYLKNNPSTISTVIHSTQGYMIKSALSMYASSYPSIYKACAMLLKESIFIFTGNDIKDKQKAAIQNSLNESMQDQTTNELSENGLFNSYLKEDFSRILLESGLVGEINRLNIVNENTYPFNNKERICIITANFEYKIGNPDQLLLLSDSQYVMHPICYEYYNCKLDKNTMVYPDRSDDDDDVIDTILKDVRL